jgi:hypothetical protein
MNQQLELPFMETPTPPETIPVNDLDHFVRMLSGWHTNRVARVKHLLEVPETAEVTIGEDEAMQVSGDFRKGFHLGLSLAIAELGELPFVAEMEESQSATKH